MIIHFYDQGPEQEYRDWVDGNPSGFALNTDTGPNARNLKTHRSGGWSIETFLYKNPLGSQSKHCSLDLAELGRWAREETGGQLDPCSFCEPDAG